MMTQTTVLGYRVTSRAGTVPCKTYVEAAAAAAGMKDAQIEPILESEDGGLTYEEARALPSPLPGVAMRQLNPAQLVEVIRRRLRATSAQIAAAQVIIQQDYGIIER